MLNRVRARLLDREDSEHEQILIRIVIAAIIAAALCAVALTGEPSRPLLHCVWLALFLLASAIGFLCHLLWKPAPNPPRRYAAMLLDTGCLTAGMILGGGTMALLYPLYLWVILGMGFRYGRRYLAISSVMALLGFGTVVIASDYWHAQPLLAASLLLALVILPAYTSTLLKKLTEALERAEESNRAKNRFLATMSHELRTPLNAIFGISDLLDAGYLDANQRDMVATMRSAGRTLLDLIDDLLDVARFESGRILPHEDRFDLHVTLSVVLRLLRRQAAEKGLDLQARIDPRTPWNVVGTERWIKQILLNLIGNAIKFTDEGDVILRVRVREIDDARAELRFEVEDTGIGISESAQEKIFEHFSQADDSTSRAYGGSGLGLSIARQLAELMGGSLTVESEIGEGACFRLLLTLGMVTTDRPRLSGRIAVLGDRESAELCETRLRSLGVETIYARHASEAFDFLASFGNRCAVLLIEGASPSTVQSCSESLNSWFGGGAPHQVLLTDDDTKERPGLFSILKTDAGDELLINVLRAALATPSMPSENDASAAMSGPPRRILVAEDNLINQRVIRKMLVSRGHIAVLAANGEELLDRLDEERFDLVLVDINMPVMSGLDAVKLHRFGSGTDHPPFVALTADATEQTRQSCAEAGFADCLTKPIDMVELLKVIDRLAVESRPQESFLPSKIISHPRFTDSQSALDPVRITRLRALDPDPTFFREIIDDFIQDGNSLVDELQNAVNMGDSSIFRDRAHALQSSATHFGATALCRLCQEWRGAGPLQLRDSGTAFMTELKAEYRRMCGELRRLVDEDDKDNLQRRH